VGLDVQIAHAPVVDERAKLAGHSRAAHPRPEGL